MSSFHFLSLNDQHESVSSPLYRYAERVIGLRKDILGSEAFEKRI